MKHKGPGSMNRVYRLVWNPRTGAMVAVAESARGCGKRSSGVVGTVLATGLLLGGAALAADPPGARALPTGGAVVAGQVRMQQGAQQGVNRLDITQGSAKAAINWQSFNIGQAAKVNISQPNAQSVLLNRVTGADPSAIHGQLTANGQVLLVNPNGIVFGKNSVVDVAGLVASTLDITDADFLAGRLNFKRNGATGSVLNQGSLKAAAGGYVALLAPEVVNEGVVSAQLGTVALAAGDAVTLEMAGSSLLGVRVDPATIRAMVDNRQLVQAEGGQVILSAGAAQRLREQAVAGSDGANTLVADNGTLRLVASAGRIEAGSVSIAASTVDLAGATRAASIDVQADYIGQGGTLDASNSAGAGGGISLAADTVLQTAQARLLADGRSGGSIRVDGGSTLYSSATFSAQGSTGRGGEIAATADSVQLRAARLDASGNSGGGRVRVGGGFQGGDSDIQNAQTLGVNGHSVLRADATGAGNGGQVVLWSDGSTVYGGQLSARGGALGGNGGRAEVSGKGDLVFAGTADLAAPLGRAGQLLLDPRNILIDNAGNSLASLNLADPTPAADNGFGSVLKVLDNGNVIITAPAAATGGSSATGAVYLFNSQTGALLSNLRGADAGDRAGSAGVRVLANGNYLVLSPSYGTVTGANVFSLSVADSNAVPGASAYAIQQTSASAGAITWQSGSGSSAGLIGSGNSLVGSTANSDSVTRYSYTGSTINNLGSISITANDRLGNISTYDQWGNMVNAGTTTLHELADGNVAVAAPNWFNGRGAVAWINGNTGALASGQGGGELSSSTALVGSTGIRSMAPVDTDTSSNKVYVLGLNSALPYTFTQGSTNRRSAPPGAAGDSVGQSLTLLPDGGYVVSSPLYTSVGKNYAGAATHGLAGGSVGAVSAGNSLVGSHAYDFVASGGVFAVGSSGSNYVVASPYWSATGNAANGHYLQNNPNGAVTWVDGSNSEVYGEGSAGAVVSSNNSMTGNAGAMTGARDTSSLSLYTAYNYPSSGAPAYTYGTRLQATGSGGLTTLHNGNYLIVNQAWDGGKGAVTFAGGDSGRNGAVSASNSLVGNTAGDAVGSGVVELSGSHYMVLSPNADLGAVDGGAVSWGSGSSGVTGALSASNSLYSNEAGSRVGSGGVLAVGALDGDGLRPNAIVLSPQWGNRSSAISTVAYGAVSWVDGSNGFAWGQGATGGLVSASNSLVGHSAGDYVGSYHYADTRSTSYVGDGSNLYQVNSAWDASLSASVDLLVNGDYIVRSPNWGGGKGAISWGAGASGTGGNISASNSLVGSTADVYSITTANATRAGFSFTDTTYRLTTTGDHVGLLGQGLDNGNYIAISPYWSTGRGAVTWVGSGNRTGTIASSNSLVGSTPDVYADANQSALTSTGDRLGTLADTTWLVPVISETTSGGVTRTTSATRPLGPYSLASGYNIATYNWYSGGGNVVLGKSYGATAPRNANLVTQDGYLSTGFQYNAYPILQELANGNVLLASPSWNNGSATRAGAVSWINGATGALVGGASGGEVSASNSLVGSHSGDVLGYRLPIDGVAELGNGNFLLVNPQWNDERGAVTWGSGTVGISGTVSASNSLVGSTGSGGLGFGAGYHIVNGSTLSYDWVDRNSDSTGDRVGHGGVTALADGNAVVGSPLWSLASAWNQYEGPSSLGAATWINGSNGQLMGGATGGNISAANSLVGSQHGDAVGFSAWIDPGSWQHVVVSGVNALAGGRYVVASPWWSSGSAAGAGAVTFGAAGGVAGAVSSSNSLVGGTMGDHVGQSQSSYDPHTYGAQIGAGVQVVVTASGTHYVVRSANWTNPYGIGDGVAAAGAGAVTWVNGNTGHAHGESSTGAVVSVANSLVGSATGDAVGSQTITLSREVNGQQVASGDLLLLSNLLFCDLPDAGAITLLSGAYGASGLVGWRNSITGLASASAGLSTSAFDGWSYSTDVRATLLPTTVTGAEQVAWRPLVWVAPNGGHNATQALALTLLADDSASPQSSDQVNGTAGNANWGGSLFAGGANGLTGVGTSGGVLGFGTFSGSDVVITPASLTALLNAGTSVTLQASNDITVLRDIITSAGGNGGNLTLEAGRSVHIRANITTDNGGFTAIANQSAANGVVDNDCSTCTAIISQAEGTSIDTGSGYLTLRLQDSSDKTSNAAGTLRVSSLDGFFIHLNNAGLDASGNGRGIRFNNGAVVGSNGTERMELFVGGNSAAGGGIVLAADTQLTGTDTLVVAPVNLGHGMVLGAANGGSGLALTTAEVGAVVHQSVGFNFVQFGSGDQEQPLEIHTLDFSQPSMLRPGSSTLNANLRFTSGNGINVLGALTSGVADGRHMELMSWGDLSLGASSSITATSGDLRINTARWLNTAALSQAAGSSINATRLTLGVEDAISLSAGSNTIGTLTGSAGTMANIQTTTSVRVGSAGFSAGSGLVLQASGASSDITLNGNVSTSSGDLVLAAGRNFINSRSTNTGLSTPAGRYLVYSADPSASTEGMTGFNKHYAQSYSAGTTPSYAGSGNWFLYSLAPTLSISAGSGSTVTYGASASAPSVGITGFIDGDTLGSATTGSLDSTLSSYTPSTAGFIPAGSYTLALNGQGTLASSLGYAISLTTGSSTLTVQPKAISVSSLAAGGKVYDGTTSTTVSGTASLVGGGSTSGDGKFMTGDSVSVTGSASGAFADRHVGVNKSVTLSGLGLSGADSANYSISAGSVTATITPKTLTISGLSADASKVYDGDTSASVAGSASLLAAQAPGAGSSSDGKAYSGDTISLSGSATGSYNAASVAAANLVSFAGLSLAGAQAGDYVLSLGSQAASITPKALTISGLTAQDKVYDSTSTVSFSGAAGLSGVVVSDSVSLAGTLAASFIDADAGIAKTITTSGLSLSGGAAGNYSLASYNPQANISQRGMVVTASDASKTYGDTDPTLSFSIGSLGLVGDDTAGGVFSGALSTSTGASATAGSHAISWGTLSLSNANYTVTSFTGGTLTVARASLGVSADAKSKTYGDAEPTLSYSVNSNQLKYSDTAGVVSGVSVSTATGAAATAGSHAISASGGAADNYDLVLSDGTLTVVKASLGVSADAKSKTYGDAEPTLSYSVNNSQLKYSDMVGVVSGINLATATGAAATAGTHAISASGGVADNYDLVLNNGTLTVAKASLGVTADAKSKTYGDAEPTLSYSVTSGQLKYSDTAGVVSGVSLATATGAAATAGSHAISTSGGTASNYDLVLSDGTLTVAKASLGVSADAKSKIYGDAEPSLSYSVNSSQLKYSDMVGVVSGINLATATGAAATAGTHAISASGGVADNYDLVLSNGTLTVAKASLGVSADAKSKTYGDAEPTLSYSVNSGQLKYSDTAGVVSGVNLATATGAAASAGSHTISASGGTASNYDLVLNNGTLTVAKASLGVSADAQSKTYGDAEPTLSYSVTSSQLKYSDTAGVVSGVSLATATGAAATAGSHAISTSGGTASNYDLVLSNSTLTVAKASLGVTADAKSKTYGDAEPTLSYSVTSSQLKYSDTAGAVSGVSLATATGAAATAGSHAISTSGGTASNYDLVLSNGTLTVAKASLGVSADAQAKTYGDAEPSLSYSVNSSQLKYSDTAGAVSGVSLVTATGAAATAGTHAINVTGGMASNYDLVLSNGTLTVAKASLGVSADAQSKTYGDADPTLSYSVNSSQLKYSDTAAVVSGVSLATATGAVATAGNHAISTSGGVASNYDLVLSNGTLTVAKASLGVSADAKSKIYGDAEPSLSYSVNSSQLKYSDTAGVVTDVSLATATGAAATAGSHAISASGGTASNYDLVLSDGTLTVAKASLVVSADAKSKTYGDAEPSLSYSVNSNQLKYSDTAGVVSGVSLSAATGAAATAGSHSISTSGGAADNYDLVLNNGTLTVAKASLGVSADAKSKAYGDAEPSLSYSVDSSQLKYSDMVGVVSGINLATATGAAATAGTHAISASGGVADNYDLVLNNGTLTVAKASLGVTADAKSKTYGDAEPSLSYSVNSSQLKYSDTAGVVSGVSLATATGAAATAGSHAISASGGTASNYDLVLNNGTLTVAKASLGVSADAKSKTYGDAEPSLSYSVNSSQLKYGDTANVVSGIGLGAATGATATAGTHAISASGGVADNYDLVLNNGTLTVAKASLGVSADAKSKTYGDAEPTLSYSVDSGQLKYSDTAGVVSGVNLATATGAAASAGSHTITASGGTASNYDLVLNNGTLTVAKASLGVSADAQSKTYGDAEPTLSYSVNSDQLKYSDTAGVVSGVSLATATGAAATAGSHAISASGGTASNYDLVLSGGTLTVAKAGLAVSADDKRKTYGDVEPTLSYSVNSSQLKYSDTAGVVSGVSLATATGAAATAGSHAISASGGTAANYTLALADATLSVAQAALAVSADNRSKTYGDVDPALSYTVDAAQLQYGDTASVVSGVSLAAPAGAAATAGTHRITASGGVAANYSLRWLDGSLSVARAALTVTADDQRKTAGESDPPLSWQALATQLRYADTSAVVSGLTLSAPGGAGLPPGDYAIVPANGTAANYTLLYVDGLLVVKPSSSVKAENLVTQLSPPAAAPVLPPSAGGAAGQPGQPGTLAVREGGLSLPPSTPEQGAAAPVTGEAGSPAGRGGLSGEPLGTGAYTGGATTPGGSTVAVAAMTAPRLVVLRPMTLVTADPARAFRLDTSVNFGRPPGAKVSYQARLADGRALPAWLKLDPATGVLSGQPPAGATLTLNLVVSVQAEGGETASTRVQMRVGR